MSSESEIENISIDSTPPEIKEAQKQYFCTWKLECLSKMTVFIIDLGSKPRSKILLDEPVSFLRAHHESSMIAVALEDFTVEILDLDTRTIIRKFVGHTGQLTDATFTPDSRWLITSSMDCTIKTWNIPSGQLIDHFKMDAACTSLTLSPTGELLATAHVDNLGVFLWANKTLYSHVTLKPLAENSEAPLVELPDCCTDDLKEDDIEVETDEELEFKSPEQISKYLVTMSTLANSRWQNLLNIDLIKKRNKPKSLLKKPQVAPFFLPTIPSLNFEFDLSAENPFTDSKLLEPMNFVNFSPFGKLVDSSIENEDFTQVIDKLKSMGPQMIDFEIKSLAPESGGNVRLMLQFLKCIEFMLKSNVGFELAQAYLAVFLKSHGNLIANETELKVYLRNLESCQNSGWERLQDKLFYNLCVIQSLKNM